MSNIHFKKQPKPRKGADLFVLPGDEGKVFIGRDWAKHNEIQENLAKTKARACFRECRTCGACSNSRRDAPYKKMYDSNAGKMIDCRGCEKFRFHDCHNGWMRDSRQEAEPFTEEAQRLFKQGGKPLI